MFHHPSGNVAGLICLRYPIVHLVFEHGSFTQSRHPGDGGITLLRCGSVGLCGRTDSGAAFCFASGYADSRDNGGLPVGANIGLSLWLMTILDAAGLALATALASMLNGSILVAVLHRRLGRVSLGSRRAIGR